MTVAAGNRTRQHRADRAMRVAKAIFETHRFRFLDRDLGIGDDLVIQRTEQAMVLFFAVVARDLGRHVRLMEYAREIQAARLPVIDAGTHVEKIRASDQVVETSNTELGHQLARFLGNKEKEVDDVPGWPVNFLRNSGSCVATPTGQVFR
jgi:hypothetical protein